MSDIAARMRTFRASTATWAANNIVLGSGELGIEVVDSTDIRIKVGDGTTAFGSLPYASASSTTINTATQTALDAKVAKSGDTMTGLLILSGDAVADLGALTKQQLDSAVSTLTTSISGKLATSGGSLSGYLTLHADPSSAMHATTKQYADTAIALKVSKSGDTMTGQLTLPGSPSDAKHAVPKEYVDGGAYQTAVGGNSSYAGKVPKLSSSGLIDPSMLPVNGAYLGTVDLTASYALSGSFSNGSYYALTDSGTIDGSWSSHLNGSPTDCYAGQLLIYRLSTTKWDLVGDTTDAAAIAGKLDKAGGTMTGDLILNADPTDPLGAVTKQYADELLPLAGGTMTGDIVLAGAPTTGLHPATKTYVDDADALAALKANNLSDLASPSTALTNLGGTTVGKAVFAAASAAAARGTLGSTTVGDAVFIAANAAAGRSALSAAASGANSDITSVALSNTGLQIADTNASHNLSIVPGSDITANRTLTLTTGDASRTLTMSGNATVSQDYSSTGYPNFNGIKENVYTITDGAAFEINPSNGALQIIVLGASRTPKGTSFAAGSSVTLHIDDGTAYAITWTDSTFGTGGVKWVGGTAPTLATSGYTIVVLWKVGSQVYGMSPGSVS